MPKRSIFVSKAKSRANAKFMEKMAKKYAGKSMKQIRAMPSPPPSTSPFEVVANYFTSTPYRQRLFMRLYKAGYYGLKYAPIATAIIGGQMATSNFRQKIIFPNSKMPPVYTPYGQRSQFNNPLWTYSKKHKTNTKNKTNKSKPKKKLQPKRVKNPVVKGQLQIVGKQIQDLRKKVHMGAAHHTYKKLEATRLVCSEALVNHTTEIINSLSEMEAFGANLRYYDPSVPGTLTTAPIATGTFSRDVNFKSVYAKLEIANNYQTPAYIKVYLVKPKGHTDTTPATLMINSDQVIGGSAITNPQIFLTELENVKDQWSIDCVLNKRLMPGQTCSTSHSEKDIAYDPAHSDGETAQYQKNFKTFGYVLRIEGALGHDSSSNTEMTTLPAGVDYQIQTVVKIEYDAGINLNDIYTTDTRTGFTNTGLVSSRPVVDNIGYSST